MYVVKIFKRFNLQNNLVWNQNCLNTPKLKSLRQIRICKSVPDKEPKSFDSIIERINITHITEKYKKDWLTLYVTLIYRFYNKVGEGESLRNKWN